MHGNLCIFYNTLAFLKKILVKSPTMPTNILITAGANISHRYNTLPSFVQSHITLFWYVTICCNPFQYILIRNIYNNIIPCHQQFYIAMVNLLILSSLQKLSTYPFAFYNNLLKASFHLYILVTLIK